LCFLLLQVSLVKVGITLLLLQRFEDSLWIFREALSVRKHALGALHPSTARIYNNIGCVHVEFNELREARRAFEAALDIQRNALCQEPESGPIMFGAATTLCNLGYLYRIREMHEKAALVLREALQLQEKVLGPQHPTVLSTLDSLAEACAASNHGSHAIKFYNEILERFHRNTSKSSTFGSSKRRKRAEAVLLYKMSRIYGQQKVRQSQLEMLKLALVAIRSVSYDDESSPEREQRELLEKRIQTDVRMVQEELEKLEWV
jgi:tetratricopeptide (TPR) repeat protein